MKPEPKLIEIALETLSNSQANQGIVEANGMILNKYKGYVASFGGSVVNLGVMPACMAFCVDENKKKVAELMFSIYRDRYGIAYPNSLKDYLKDHWSRQWNQASQKTFRSRITKVAVSLKLAMRTYQFDESNSID